MTDGQAMQSMFETPTERLDRLILTGRRTLTVDGIACWCPIGKHWLTYPLPDQITETWWDTYSDAMADDHARCATAHEEAAPGHPTPSPHP